MRRARAAADGGFVVSTTWTVTEEEDQAEEEDLEEGNESGIRERQRAGRDSMGMGQRVEGCGKLSRGGWRG